MNNLIYNLPDVFYAINVIGGCLLVLLFVLIVTNSFGD
jgi:hypothetical protein